MFLGPVKGKGICRFCAEFKHAHSPGIFKGIEVQLPLYMQSKTQNMGHIVFYILKEIGLTNQKIRQWDN